MERVDIIITIYFGKGEHKTEIRLINISKKFGGKAVINPLTMTIESGGFTTLLGPSGCGKTTLLRIISGLETSDTGEIYFNDKLIFSAEKKINVPPEKRKLGFVFQDFSLWPHITVYENVAFGLRATKNTANLNERVMNALKAVKLEDYHSRYPHQLSGGQQQRVAFARAIVTEPECILFDEPLSALDALLREEMRVELKELVARLKTTAVFVTHDQTEAMSLSDKIAVLSNGNIEQYDTPENVYSSPATEFAARFVGSSNWIENNTMFRPESASLEPDYDTVEYKTTVTSVQFLGSSYQVTLDYNGEKWTLITKSRMSVGTLTPIYIKKESIINV